MSYNIKIEQKDGYLKILASGKQAMNNNKELVYAILNECTKREIENVIVDIRGFEGQAAVHEDYALAGYTAKEGENIINKAAILHSPEKETETYFFTDATRERGINVLPFLSEEDAIKWIKEE